MNPIKFRVMKGHKRAVTPVIATIILIAATLVLALVVGAYTFGLFGSNVKTVTLTSATLYGGVTSANGVVATSSLGISLNNPGSQSYITTLTLTGTGLTAPITLWDNTSAAQGAANEIVFSSGTYQTGAASCSVATWNWNTMCAGQVTSFNFYPGPPGTLRSGASAQITTGQTFNYVINFANGQSVSGSLIAQ
jgi:flagellin-like protein